MQMQIFDTMTEEYLQATQNWFSYVESAGMHLMVILVLIQFTLKISKSILSGEGNAMAMMATTIRQLVIVAILYYLITNAGTLLPQLFNSFTALGVAGSTITKLDPSSVVSEGLSIASAILQGFNSYGVLTNIAFAIFGTFCCIAIVICYGLIAADLMITLIESYFLVAVSSLFIAFGSTSYTLPMAREYLGMTIGVGIKLMMLYLMIAVGVQLGNDWVQLINQAMTGKDWTTYLGVAVGAIIYYLIVKTVPARIASAASQAFAISHMGDVTGTVFAGVANTATAASLAMGSVALAKASFSQAGHGASWLHGQLSPFFSHGHGGLESAAGSVSALNHQPSGLASSLLNHLDKREPKADGVITPSVIYLPQSN